MLSVSLLKKHPSFKKCRMFFLHLAKVNYQSYSLSVVTLVTLGRVQINLTLLSLGTKVVEHEVFAWNAE